MTPPTMAHTITMVHGIKLMAEIISRSDAQLSAADNQIIKAVLLAADETEKNSPSVKSEPVTVSDGSCTRWTR